MKINTLIILTTALYCTPVLACEQPNTRVVVDALIGTQPLKAQNHIEQWQAIEPNHPMLPVMKVALALTQADMDRVSAEAPLPASLLKIIDKTISELEAREDADSLKTQLAIGIANTYLALIHVSHKNWLDAAQVGRSARKKMQKIVQDRPDQNEAYLVLGLFEFYLGSIPKKWQWAAKTAGYSGDKDLGLDLIKKTLRLSTDFSTEAGRILLLEHTQKALLLDDYQTACEYQPLASQMHQRFPINNTFGLISQILTIQCSNYQSFINHSLKINDQCSVPTEKIDVIDAGYHSPQSEERLSD